MMLSLVQKLCLLSTALLSRSLPAPIQGVFGLLCLLPQTTAELDDNTWVSLQGEEGETGYSVSSLSLTPDDVIVSSGSHSRGHPNYDGIVTILNNEGDLTHDLMMVGGSNIQFFAGTYHNNSIFSAGNIFKTQTNALLCETSLNGTLLDCFEFTGLAATTRIRSILGTTDNTLLLAGQTGLAMARYPNNTLKFAYQYPMANSVTFQSIAETKDHEYIFSGINQGSIWKASILKTDQEGEIIWAKDLGSTNATHLWTQAIKAHNNTLVAVGTLNKQGAIITLDSTTGNTLNTTLISGTGTTVFQDVVLINNTALAVGRSNVNTVGSFDGIIFFKNKLYKLAGISSEILSSVSLDTNNNIIIAGTTGSYEGDFGKRKLLTVKLDPNLKLDASNLPPGLDFYECTDDFEITHEVNITNTDTTASINPVDLKATTSLTNITEEITVSSPLENTWLHAPSPQPSGEPSGQPSGPPSGQPSGQPSGEPSGQPSGQPSAEPSGSPSGQPSGEPSGEPTGQPSATSNTKKSSLSVVQGFGIGIGLMFILAFIKSLLTKDKKQRSIKPTAVNPDLEANLEGSEEKEGLETTHTLASSFVNNVLKVVTVQLKQATAVIHPNPMTPQASEGSKTEEPSPASDASSLEYPQLYTSKLKHAPSKPLTHYITAEEYQRQYYSGRKI